MEHSRIVLKIKEFMVALFGNTSHSEFVEANYLSELEDSSYGCDLCQGNCESTCNDDCSCGGDGKYSEVIPGTAEEDIIDDFLKECI